MSENRDAIQRTLDGKNYPDISIDLKLGSPKSNPGKREADIDFRWRSLPSPKSLPKIWAACTMACLLRKS
jgi:hypothetical protein